MAEDTYKSTFCIGVFCYVTVLYTHRYHALHWPNLCLLLPFITENSRKINIYKDFLNPIELIPTHLNSFRLSCITFYKLFWKSASAFRTCLCFDFKRMDYSTIEKFVFFDNIQDDFLLTQCNVQYSCHKLQLSLV